MGSERLSACCASPLRNKGWARGGDRVRFCCTTCGKYESSRKPPAGRLRLALIGDQWKVITSNLSGFLPVTTDSRGRLRVQLGVGAPFANSGGWQYVSRFIVMQALGRPLRRDEHCHHLTSGIEALDEYELLLAEYHGSLHAWATTLAGGRGADGRFRAIEPHGTQPWPRFRAIMGPAAVAPGDELR